MRDFAEAGRRKEISSNGSKGEEAEVIAEGSSGFVFTLVMNGTGGMNSTVHTGGLSTGSIEKNYTCNPTV